jgi:hypothetical protein
LIEDDLAKERRERHFIVGASGARPDALKEEGKFFYD